ncbi:MAG: NGG1p interacting factor NIF3 [Candidatus Magasanikbacteria bacterium]|nr:NGG1p interacting factor NIF3 [Candidatus Magasanikbacteria bacterium]
MTIRQVFELGLKLAIAADPRGRAGVLRHLARVKKAYQDLKPSEKKWFDQEKLTNPYADSAVHVDDGKTTVRRALAGIDINGPEILLASQLNERGKKIDLVISHHPEGKGLANLHEVMELFVDVYDRYHVPVHIAEKIIEERIKEVGRGVHPINHFQAIDIAKALGINFISTHTITDNLVDNFMRGFLARKKSATVGDLMEALLELPEYQAAKRAGAGPKIISGGPGHRTGKILIEMTGGTNPSPKVYERLSQYGISTIVGMHMRDEAMKQASESHLNVIIAGHISSDSLGMNLFLDELEKRGVEIVPCGGLIRVSRLPQPKAKSKRSH